MTDSKKPLQKIKSGVFSRGLSLARTSLSVGAKAASHSVGNLFASEEARPERLKELLVSQLKVLSKELGELKGSLMKVGQMLSMYGEHFLPPEANAFLKTLQSESPPLSFTEIEKVLRRQLSQEQLALVEIDPVPLASASLGQVHRAIRKSDGKALAMKVQYPGVDEAIESDLRALRRMLSISKLVPKGPNYDEIFAEVRQMLHQEVDYGRELEMTSRFRGVLASDERYVIPEVFPELSAKRVITTSFESGVPVDSPEVRALSQERRDRLAEAALELYLRELFELQIMQTDPHFGNYRVRVGKEGEPDRLVLLDFGAVRKFPKSFLDPYHQLVAGAYFADADRLEKAGMKLGMLREGDSPQIVAAFVELCLLMTKPFAEAGAYDWGASDLPRQVARRGAELAFTWKLRTPPRELIFLDRKMSGVFIFLSVLGAKISGREVLGKYLNQYVDRTG